MPEILWYKFFKKIIENKGLINSPLLLEPMERSGMVECTNFILGGYIFVPYPGTNGAKRNGGSIQNYNNLN